jgi:glucosamine--fructose-6-phosphate aminotransferase (isomerizing)
VTTTLASSFMAAEMAEQPACLRRLLARRTGLRARIAHAAPHDLRGVAFVGRGSSANAALFGRVIAELATGRPALLVSPSADRLYPLRTDYSGYLAIGLSQSGRTPEVVSTLAAMQAAGAHTIGLTSDGDSPLARSADTYVDLCVGVERAVPTTKAFTAQLAALIIIGEALGGEVLSDVLWGAAAHATQAVLDDQGQANLVATHLAAVTHLSVVGAGTFLGIAEEIALKLQEVALIAASAQSSASYRHGPFALSGAGDPLLAVVGPGAAGDETRALVADVRAMGAPVTVIGATGDLPVPNGLPEVLAALPTVVRGQQLALALALDKGLDPDRPPGLSKVTNT